MINIKLYNSRDKAIKVIALFLYARNFFGGKINYFVKKA